MFASRLGRCSVRPCVVTNATTAKCASNGEQSFVWVSERACAKALRRFVSAQVVRTASCQRMITARPRQHVQQTRYFNAEATIRPLSSTSEADAVLNWQSRQSTNVGKRNDVRWLPPSTLSGEVPMIRQELLEPSAGEETVGEILIDTRAEIDAVHDILDKLGTRRELDTVVEELQQFVSLDRNRSAIAFEALLDINPTFEQLQAFLNHQGLNVAPQHNLDKLIGAVSRSGLLCNNALHKGVDAIRARSSATGTLEISQDEKDLCSTLLNLIATCMKKESLEERTQHVQTMRALLAESNAVAFAPDAKQSFKNQLRKRLSYGPSLDGLMKLVNHAVDVAYAHNSASANQRNSKLLSLLDVCRSLFSQIPWHQELRLGQVAAQVLVENLPMAATNTALRNDNVQTLRKFIDRLSLSETQCLAIHVTRGFCKLASKAEGDEREKTLFALDQWLQSLNGTQHMAGEGSTSIWDSIYASVVTVASPLDIRGYLAHVSVIEVAMALRHWALIAANRALDGESPTCTADLQVLEQAILDSGLIEETRAQKFKQVMPLVRLAVALKKYNALDDLFMQQMLRLVYRIAPPEVFDYFCFSITSKQGSQRLHLPLDVMREVINEQALLNHNIAINLFLRNQRYWKQVRMHLSEFPDLLIACAFNPRTAPVRLLQLLMSRHPPWNSEVLKSGSLYPKRRWTEREVQAIHALGMAYALSDGPEFWNRSRLTCLRSLVGILKAWGAPVGPDLSLAIRNTCLSLRRDLDKPIKFQTYRWAASVIDKVDGRDAALRFLHQAAIYARKFYPYRYTPAPYLEMEYKRMVENPEFYIDPSF